MSDDIIKAVSQNSAFSYHPASCQLQYLIYEARWLEGETPAIPGERPPSTNFLQIGHLNSPVAISTDIRTTELFCLRRRHEQGTKHSLGPLSNPCSVMANNHMMPRGNPFPPASCCWRVGLVWFSLGRHHISGFQMRPPSSSAPFLAVWSHHVLLFLPQDPVLFPHEAL